MRRWQFFKNALHDHTVGALFPSSRYAADTILRHIPKTSTGILEYGPGDGAITSKLLNQFPLARITAIELNKKFVQLLKNLENPRLTVLEQDIYTILADRVFSKSAFDVVISGIPFSFFPPKKREYIIAETSKLLKLGGVGIIYQYTPLVYPLLKKYFTKTSMGFTARNFPPYFIMMASNA